MSFDFRLVGFELKDEIYAFLALILNCGAH